MDADCVDVIGDCLWMRIVCEYGLSVGVDGLWMRIVCRCGLSVDADCLWM